jgi:hypothetical protein
MYPAQRRRAEVLSNSLRQTTKGGSLPGNRAAEMAILLALRNNVRSARLFFANENGCVGAGRFPHLAVPFRASKNSQYLGLRTFSENSICGCVNWVRTNAQINYPADMKTKSWVLMFAATTTITLLSPFASSGALITQWNFNADSTTPSTGSGTILAAGGTTLGFSSGRDSALNQSTDPVTPVSNNRALTVSVFPEATVDNRTAGAQFNVSTLGYQNIIVSWDQRHTDTSSRYVRFQYSLDGVGWSDFDSFAANQSDTTWYTGRIANLLSVSGAADNSSFAFRIVSEFQSTAPGGGTAAYVPSDPTSSYSVAGTWRFDMVTISGELITPVPEPKFYALFCALGLLAICGGRTWLESQRSRKN